MPEHTKLPYTVEGQTLEDVEAQFKISDDISRGIRKEIGREWLFILAEKNLSDIGKRTGLKDMAMQCAFGNKNNVLIFDIDTIERSTGEAIELTLYFVERFALRESTFRKRSERERVKREHDRAQQAN